MSDTVEILADEFKLGYPLTYDAIYNRGRAEGRAEIQSELMTEVAMLNETKMTEGDLKCFAYRIKAIAEKKMCSNGQPCTHPNCKRCGTTHFMSECDYRKEQSNE